MTNEKPQNYDELYPGRFLKAGTLKDGKETFTIEDTDVEELGIGAQKKIKAILFFEGGKAHVACKTNGICLREMFGRQLSGWVGKRVTLFASEFNHQPAIRVWGSPDIERDMPIIIDLPNKTPFKMVMHAVGRERTYSGPGQEPAQGQASKAETVPVPPHLQVYATLLAQAKTTDDLDAIRDRVVDDSGLTLEETKRIEAGIDKRYAKLLALPATP